MGAFAILAGIAAANVVGDDAGWDENFLAATAAIAPYLISATIVWATGEIIKAMRNNQKEQPRETTSSS
jgi:hypothetical protein